MRVLVKTGEEDWTSELTIKKETVNKDGYCTDCLYVQAKVDQSDQVYDFQWDLIPSLCNQEPFLPKYEQHSNVLKPEKIRAGFYQFKVSAKPAENNGQEDITKAIVKIAIIPRKINPCDEIEEHSLWVTEEEIKHLVKEEKFPIENIVFSGGGSKGMAYCGVAQYLDEIGLLPRIQRFAGASAGAICALILALGHDTKTMRKLMEEDFEKKLFGDWGIFNWILPKKIKDAYGWGRMYFGSSNGQYSLDGFTEWMGKEIIHPICENTDITFAELYQKTRKELCVVVTNMNEMREEYCHMKTTPHMSVLLAVKMSMAIPGMFDSVESAHGGYTCRYVDGGVTNNYPLYCFDGWWLSGDPEDSFEERLFPYENIEQIPKVFEKRFFDQKHKTLGFMLYADNEPKILRPVLQHTLGTEITWLPETKLRREKETNGTVNFYHPREWISNKEIEELAKVLENKHRGDENEVSLKQLGIDIMKNLKKEHRWIFDERIIKGTNDENTKIPVEEIRKYVVEKSSLMRLQWCLGSRPKEISDAKSYGSSALDLLSNNAYRIGFRSGHVHKTVGINTGHVETTDFGLEEDDKKFLQIQGMKSTEAYFRYYAAKIITHHKKWFEVLPGAFDGIQTVSLITNMPKVPVQTTDVPKIPIQKAEVSRIPVQEHFSSIDWCDLMRSECIED